MSTSIVDLKRAVPPNPTAIRAKPDSLRFALALPILMALLLALVPVLGATAKVTFLLALVPLVLWTAFTDTEKAIYVYIAWCWMDGTIRGCFDNSPLSIVARDLVLGVVVTGWAARRLQTRQRDPIRVPPGTLLVILFVISCLVQVFNPYSLGLVNSLGGLKVHLGVIPLFFIGYDTFRRRDQVRSLFVFLTLASLVIGLVSFVQYIMGQDWTWAHFPGTKDVILQNGHAMVTGDVLSDAAKFRPPGTATFGGETAGYVAAALPFTFALLLLSRKAGLPSFARPVLMGILFAFIVIIFINGVRSALIESAAGCALVGWLVGGTLRVRTLAALAACFAVGMAAYAYSASVSDGGVADRFASTFADPNQALHSDRKTVFDEFLTVAAEAPMGVGLGRTGAAAGRLGTGSSDSLGFSTFSESYIDTMIFETGLMGAFLITSLAIYFSFSACRIMNCLSTPDDKLMTAAIASYLILILGNFAVINILGVPPGSVMFWLLAAVIMRVYGSSAPREAIVNGTLT